MAHLIERKFTIWTSLAGAAVLESIRRKDLYVAMILSMLMIGGAATVGAFGVKGIEMFLKDVALTVVNLLSILMTIVFAARQIPEELSRRTVYPLLARPITRGDLIFGKFLGAFALSSVSLLLFASIAWGALAVYGLSVGTIFVQYLLLRFFSLALLTALTILLSLLMNTDAAITVALLLAVGSATFSRAILLLDGQVGSVARFFMRGSYYVLPHLDLFDLSRKVSYGWNPVGGWVIGALFLYGLFYTVVFLGLGMWRFQKRAV